MRRGMNWNAVRARNAMRRRGTESGLADSESMVRRMLPEHSSTVRPTKADQRAEAAAAFLAWRAKRAAEEE
jgi:hypothetical protein